MSKFKVGDKVIAYKNNINDSSNYGKIGIILKIDDNVDESENDKYYIKYTGGDGSELWSGDIKLVEEEKCEPCAYDRFSKFAEVSGGLYQIPSDMYIGELGDYQIYQTKEKQKTIMLKITTFAKNLVLSADEKVLRKYGLKNECGEFTDEAESLVIAKLVKENEAYLIELAKGMEAEEAKK